MKRVIVEYFEVEVTQPNMLLFVWRQCMLEYFQSLPEAHIFLSTVGESSKTDLQFVFRQSTDANDEQRHGMGASGRDPRCSPTPGIPRGVGASRGIFSQGSPGRGFLKMEPRCMSGDA